MIVGLCLCLLTLSATVIYSYSRVDAFAHYDSITVDIRNTRIIEPLDISFGAPTIEEDREFVENWTICMSTDFFARTNLHLAIARIANYEEQLAIQQQKEDEMYQQFIEIATAVVAEQNRIEVERIAEEERIAYEAEQERLRLEEEARLEQERIANQPGPGRQCQTYRNDAYASYAAQRMSAATGHSYEHWKNVIWRESTNRPFVWGGGGNAHFGFFQINVGLHAHRGAYAGMSVSTQVEVAILIYQAQGGGAWEVWNW